jgi:hypothetical protein
MRLPDGTGALRAGTAVGAVGDSDSTWPQAAAKSAIAMATDTAPNRSDVMHGISIKVSSHTA